MSLFNFEGQSAWWGRLTRLTKVAFKILAVALAVRIVGQGMDWGSNMPIRSDQPMPMVIWVSGVIAVIGVTLLVWSLLAPDPKKR